MGDLLKAGFYRLGKSKLFFGLVIATITMSMITFLDKEAQVILEQKFLNNLNFISFIIALFVAIYVSTEFAEGTIRNKIVAGHHKMKIYLSTFIINAVFSIIIEVVCLVTTVILCAIKSSGNLEIEWSRFFTILCNATMITFAYSAIFTLIGLVLSDITASIAMVLLITFLMFLAGMNLVNKVEQSKYNYGITMDGDELVEATIMDDNPFFPGEEKIKIYKSILYFNPTGDAMLMAKKFTKTVDIENRLDYSNVSMVLALAGETILFTLAGMGIFQKKQLR